jgi:hypothetical protein
MQVTFDPFNVGECEIIQAIIARCERKQEQQRTAPASSTMMETLKRLMRSQTGKTFLKPAVEKIWGPDPNVSKTASEIDTALGLGVGATESYMRIIHKFCRRHPALPMTELFEIIGSPRKYKPKAASLTHMQTLLRP